MENTPTPNSDFESYLRKNLEQIDASPDDDVWAQIAGKQAQPNQWLKFRRWAIYATGAVLFIIATAGIWRYHHGAQGLKNPENTGQEQSAPAGGQPMPMATATPADPLPVPDTKAIDVAQNGKKYAYVPNFSPRVNSVPASSIRFKAENGLRYQSPITGTSVSIPANSLVDENGQPVNGEAELFFREYRTVADFLASGIPMHYTDDRGPFFFNSGGMFEVRVSQAGTPLQMAAGQGYAVDFAATQSLENASLYYLDDKTGRWEFRPEVAFGQANLNQPPVSPESTVVNNNQGKKSTECRPQPGQLAVEPDPAELVQLGVQTGFELATGKLSMPTWFRKNPTLTDDQLLFRMERGLIQIKKHRDQSQLFFPEDLNKFFTELAAFKNCYFAYNVDSLGLAKNAKFLTSSDYWQRITVAQVKGANCVITLYDGSDSQMQFHAVLSGSTENKNFNPEQVIAEYERLRLQRQQDFARKNKALRYFLYAADAFKTKEEYCYTAPEWLEYFEKNHPLMARRYAERIKEGLTTDLTLATAAWKKWQGILRDQKFDRFESLNQAIQPTNNLAYSLRLSRFGTYNCDQIFRLGGEFVNTGYKTANGARIIPASVSILERKTKLFFSLPTASQMVFSPGKQLDVIVTDKTGRQYHFPAEKYANQKFDKTGVTVLTLNDVTDKTQSPRAWAELLEI